MERFFRLSGFRPRSWRRIILSLLLLTLFAHIIYYASTSATQEGPWKPYYERLPTVRVVDDTFYLQNFRRARHDGNNNLVSIAWENRTVELEKLQSVWLGISVFAEPALAHTFLSFDFGDGDPLVVSVEARQRPEQSYSPVDGLYDAFHLIYVVADEQDIISVRTHDRHEKVYFHPLTIRPVTMKRLFRDMMERVDQLSRQPEFYNTFTSNCTNSLLKGSPYSLFRKYLDYRVVLPGFADRAAWAEDIIDRRYPLESLQRASLIDPAAYSPAQADMSAFFRTEYYRRLSSENMLEKD